MAESYEIELYVAGGLEKAHELRESLLSAFREAGKSANITIVDVLSMPEKALEKDIFATPTLLRVLPAPVIKVIANVEKAPNIALVLSEKES